MDDAGIERNTYRANGVDALAVSLARLAYPGRLRSLLDQLHLSWSVPKGSSIIKAVIMHLHRTFGPRVQFDPRFFADHQQLAVYAQAIEDLCPSLQTCVGFLDGTTMGISRPGEGVNAPAGTTPGATQRPFYSGHKRYHCLRFQGIIFPDGMMASFFGPYPGASNDRGLYGYSNVDNLLLQIWGSDPQYPNLAKYFLYADAGYDGSYASVVSRADLPQGDGNAANSVRVSIENIFGSAKGRCLGGAVEILANTSSSQGSGLSSSTLNSCGCSSRRSPPKSQQPSCFIIV